MKKHNAYILSAMLCVGMGVGVAFFGIQHLSKPPVVESMGSSKNHGSYGHAINVYTTLSMIEKYAK